MGSAGASKVFLHVLNAILILLGLGITAASLWFFVQVYEFTSLRNSNHYMLDYKVYWTQAVPWMFFIVGIFVLCVSSCGFVSAKRNSRGLLKMYIGFSVFVIVMLTLATVLALVFADNQATDNFVKDTIWDVYFQSKIDEDVSRSYQNIERKLHCCGADSPRDYKNWKNEFPTSCCDTYYHGWLDTFPIDCQFTDKLANERYGCTTVAAQYARIAIKVLSGASVFTAVICIISILVAIALSSALREKKTRVMAARYDSESKKVLI